MRQRHSESYLPRPAGGVPPANGPQRAFQIAETLSWGLMLLGLAAAAAVLINSYLLAG